MQTTVLLASVRATVRLVPEVLPHLSTKARFEIMEPVPYKTYEFFRSAILGLVNGVYYNNVGGIFIDTMANLISGQLLGAFQQGWADEGHFSELPDYLNQAYETMVLGQYEHIDQFFKDIVDARIDGTSIAPLLQRAEMWANQYQAAYNEAIRQIALANGGKLQWHFGDTDHCNTCLQLDGIVAYAREWEALGVRPQSPPNALLDCGGWRCKCSLSPTDQRRSPKAFETIMNIVGAS